MMPIHEKWKTNLSFRFLNTLIRIEMQQEGKTTEPSVLTLCCNQGQQCCAFMLVPSSPSLLYIEPESVSFWTPCKSGVIFKLDIFTCFPIIHTSFIIFACTEPCFTIGGTHRNICNILCSRNIGDKIRKHWFT